MGTPAGAEALPWWFRNAVVDATKNPFPHEKRYNHGRASSHLSKCRRPGRRHSAGISTLRPPGSERRLPGFIGPVPPPLWIRVRFMASTESTRCTIVMLGAIIEAPPEDVNSEFIHLLGPRAAGVPRRGGPLRHGAGKPSSGRSPLAPAPARVRHLLQRLQDVQMPLHFGERQAPAAAPTAANMAWASSNTVAGPSCSSVQQVLEPLLVHVPGAGAPAPGGRQRAGRGRAAPAAPAAPPPAAARPNTAPASAAGRRLPRAAAR